MKKTVLLAGLAMSLLAGFRSEAQVHVNVNLGAPVAEQSWYANDNDYYYMPEQGVYYNTRRKVYVFQEGGRWLSARRLPQRYGNLTYSNTRYVRVRDRSPFDRDNDYKQRYGRNSHDNGRRDNGRHDNEHHDNGNHYGHDRH